MRGWPAGVVVVAVVVAVIVSIWAFISSRGPSSDSGLRALEESVRDLRGEVRDLREAVRDLREVLAAGPAHEVVAPEREAAAVGRDETGFGGGEVNVEPVDVVLEVKMGGACVLAGRAVARDELRAELKKVLEANPAMTLIVRPDETVPMVEVNRVLDEVQGVGIHRVSLSTSAPLESAGPE
jgi:biopolymer transport protein ExbD